MQPWRAKISKMAQPDLDFIAPEIQLEKSKFAVPACDAFSLGLLICSVFNGGRSLIQAQYNPACYVKELGRVGNNPIVIMPQPLIGGGIKRCFCLTSVCLTSDVGLSRISGVTREQRGSGRPKLAQR